MVDALIVAAIVLIGGALLLRLETRKERAYREYMAYLEERKRQRR